MLINHYQLKGTNNLLFMQDITIINITDVCQC